MFTYDARIWRTLRRLVASPGFLSREYVLGRRARYTPPFRLYLVVSLLTFLTLSFLVDHAGIALPGNVRIEIDPPPPAAPTAPAGETSWLERQRLALERNGAAVAADPARLLGNIVGMLPQTMFVLLPLLALIATPFYRASRRYYVEHAVFMMHAHAFVFLVLLLVFSVAALRSRYAESVWAAPLAGLDRALWLWMAVYVLVAMRRFYAEGWLRTGVQFAALSAIYAVLLLVAAVALYNHQRLSMRLVLVAVLVAASFYLLFVRLLNIPLPPGLWPDVLPV